MFALLLLTTTVTEPHSIELRVTSQLPSANVPMDPAIDFAEIIRQRRLPGVLDPNSIDVVNLTTGKVVPHARTDDFAYGDKGRIEWVIRHPRHKRYLIRFKTSKKRPPALWSARGLAFFTREAAPPLPVSRGPRRSPRPGCRA